MVDTASRVKIFEAVILSFLVSLFFETNSAGILYTDRSIYNRNVEAKNGNCVTGAKRVCEIVPISL